MHGHDLIIFCLIIVAGFVCQWIAWRTRTPAILFLLVVGILAGPVFDWIKPDELLGDLLVPFVSIGVAIILFEGALTLKFSEIRGHGNVVRNLVTIGVLITWAGSGLAAYYLLEWPLYLAALFGAIVTVSGPTVVIPLLRSLRPAKAVGSVLRWEAILIDPIGAVLGLLVFEFILAAQVADGFAAALSTVMSITIAGLALGAAAGYLFGLAIRRRKIPDFLRDYAVLAFVMTAFGLAEYVHSESGLLAVTIMGIWLANMRDVELEDILDFKESMTLVLVAALFIVLAARVDIGAVIAAGGAVVFLVLVLQVVVGPLRAFACGAGGDLNWRELLFIGWTFPRGIVAAAISSIFALRLESNGITGAGDLVPAVFSVIIGTVVIQSIASPYLARRLGVVEPDASGVLIVGSNALALAVARAIHDQGQTVLVADSDWDGIQDARMAGLPAFYGSAVSGYADEKLDLTGLGHLLAMSRRPGINELACVKFAAEFGRDHVYTISNQSADEHDKHKVTGERRGRVLFDGELSIMDLQRKLYTGAKIKTTELSDEYNWDAYRAEHPQRLVLFARNENKRLRFPVIDEEFAPAAGWTVSALAG